MSASVVAKSVVLATSWAPLLSGRLDQCSRADDPTCRGGVAAFRAMLRHRRGTDPAVHLQLLDTNDAFVHMHPLGLSVNRFILHELMGLGVFAAPPSILLRDDDPDLQTRDMPLLLTNAAVPPANSWHPFTEAIHFDAGTGLAVMSISKTNEELNTPQLESALGSLRHVRRVNEENGCVRDRGDEFGDYVRSRGNATGDADGGDGAAPPASSPADPPRSQCWLPIVYHSDDADRFEAFLEGVLGLPEPHRPAMVIDTGGNFERYATPTLVDGVWVASHAWDSRSYFHDRLDISYGGPTGPKLIGAEFLSVPLSPLPEEAKDDTYTREILALRAAADEALENNPVVGHSTAMPVTRDASGYRPCKSGECPIGNLYTDAARWYANADLAFITSGGVRGPGWPAGKVTVADVWTALPFPNNLCTGYINGVHLFQLLNYSMSVATFEGEDTDDGGRLLQVSGLRVTYNTQLDSSRIISIDVMDRDAEEFRPIERLRTYKFATDSFLCDVYAPFPALLGSEELVVEGEQPGRVESVLYQEMLVGFLKEVTSPGLLYNTETQSRLRNDTSATAALNLIQTEDGCAPGTFWKPEIETCLACPVDFDVGFVQRRMEFEVVSQSEARSETDAAITLKNRERFGVAVIPKSLPEWLEIESDNTDYKGTESPTALGPGESLPLSMRVKPRGLEPGTVFFTIAFGVLDGGDYPGCIGQDSTFDIVTRVYPAEQKNQLGSISAVGFVLFGIIALTSISFATFVLCNRRQQVVRALQPIFLVTICLGVLVMGSAIVPVSIDDAMVSREGCNVKCMATPWLLSMGFSVAISALFAKLWRVNRLFNASRGFRRVQVNAKDVAKPMAALVLVNFIVLLSWSFIDPLVWQRFEIEGASWNTFGICADSDGNIFNEFLLVSAILNLGALVLALVQAWRARTVSDEYSETKTVGVALYSWLQLLVVSVPVMVMIDKDNTKPRYFLLVALIFAVCMSMLLIIFVPLLLQIRRAQQQRKVQASDLTAAQTASHVSRDTRALGRSARISGLGINPARLNSSRISGLSNPRTSGVRMNPVEELRRNISLRQGSGEDRPEPSAPSKGCVEEGGGNIGRTVDRRSEAGIGGYGYKDFIDLVHSDPSGVRRRRSSQLPQDEEDFPEQEAQGQGAESSESPSLINRNLDDEEER